jgi:hypothetical protein
MMRTYTRPDIKWLINEIAMLAGELQHIGEEIARLEKHRVAVEQAHQACLQSLGVVICETPPQLPVVRQRRPYGGYGALRRLLMEILRGAAPKAMDAGQLTQLVVQGMGLSFPSPLSLNQFKRGTVGRALRYFAEKGVIERIDIRAPGPTTVRVWRWKAELSTIAALAKDAELAAQRKAE